MKTKNLDVVIPLKESNDNEELRYVLRSIAANLPHRKIFLAGFTPDWVKGVESINVEIPQGLKYSKSLANTKAACADPRVSDDFILFNDDFFVMQPVESIEPVHRGSLRKFHALFASKNHRYRNYRDGIGRMRDILEYHFGIAPEAQLCYELHVPMIFNKAKRLECYEIQDRFPAGDLALHTNTLYGNINHVGGNFAPDVKYFDSESEPDPDLVFISSDDESFKHGLVGEFVREAFPKPCKYER